MRPSARRRREGRTATLATAALWLTVATAAAVDFRTADRFQLDPDAAVSNELWLATGAADLAGRVENQLFLYATNAVLRGSFADDAWVAAGAVTFSGTAENHLRLAGLRTVVFSGSAADSLLAAAPTVKLDTGSVVRADALLAGEDVLTEARIEGRLRILGARVTLGGDIGGPVHVVSEELVVLPGTRIRGDLVYSMDQDLVLSKDVTLDGELVKRPLSEWLAAVPGQSASFSLALQGLFFFNAFLIGCVALMLMPRMLAHAATRLRFSAGRCLLVGSLALLLFPLLLQLLLLLRTTLVAVLILGSAFAVLLYAAKLVPALLLGTYLLRRQGAQPLSRVVLCLFIGLLVLYTVQLTPLLGSLVWVGSTCLGLGAFLVNLYESQLRYQVTISPAAPTPRPPRLPGHGAPPDSNR